MHAFILILVFVAVAPFDKNVISCFLPTLSDETQEINTRLPVGNGDICSMLFIIFPTNRNGIGFPLSANEQKISFWCQPGLLKVYKLWIHLVTTLLHAAPFELTR